MSRLSELLGRDVETALAEEKLFEIESRLRNRMELLPSEAPFRRFHNGDLVLARLCYAVVRALKPECILETGVCYGVTSSFVLEACEQNRKGKLDSIDLPPLGRKGDQFVGWAISDDALRTRWRLHRGVSRRILPTLLAQVGQVPLFIHDSLHTYRNMKMEFDLVWPYIPPGGVLISDDIQDNRAFQELAERTDVAFHATVRELEKDSLVGIVSKGV